MTNHRPTAPSRAVVLLVDDEQGMRDVLTLGLNRHFEVESARSTHEAELMLGTREFDVVVCDHMMPDEEGLPFLIRARERYPKVQRILLTGYVNPELLSRSTELAGLASVLMKPVSTDQLVETIRMVLPR
jgi:two-component system response regulator HupR/HoxA